MVAISEQRQPAADVMSSECPSRELLERATSKWTPLVLSALREGPARFSDLARGIDGISDRLLTARLRDLEGDGWVVREAPDTDGAHPSYALSPAGRDLAIRLEGVVAFLEGHVDGRGDQGSR